MTLLLMIAAASLLTGTMLFAIQATPLPVGTVDPFAGPVPTRDAASDTVANEALIRTAPPARRTESEWQVRTLTSLHEVEMLLDRLEACGVSVREVNTIGSEGFMVRWK